eukprot:6201311-Pleurochrysis_carterae.AAC.4
MATASLPPLNEVTTPEVRAHMPRENAASCSKEPSREATRESVRSTRRSSHMEALVPTCQEQVPTSIRIVSSMGV